MYKKITHTIVEEHFDHPMASQIKKSMSKPTTINSEILSENKFRTDATAYFQLLRAKLNSMINSVNGTEEELITPFEDLFRNNKIDELGNMTKPLYPSEFGERLNEAMRALVLTTFLITQTLKMGKDVTPLLNRFLFIRNDIANNLSSFNSRWVPASLNPLFAAIGEEIIKQIKARLKKDSGAEVSSSQAISQNFAIFEKALIDGIITQYPERFSKATIAESFNSDDIM